MVSVASPAGAFEGLLQFFFRHFVVVVDVSYLDMLPSLGSNFCLCQKAIVVLVCVLEVAGPPVLAAACECCGWDGECETDGSGSDDANGLGGHCLNLPSLGCLLRPVRA